MAFRTDRSYVIVSRASVTSVWLRRSSTRTGVEFINHTLSQLRVSIDGTNVILKWRKDRNKSSRIDGLTVFSHEEILDHVHDVRNGWENAE